MNGTFYHSFTLFVFYHDRIQNFCVWIEEIISGPLLLKVDRSAFEVYYFYFVSPSYWPTFLRVVWRLFLLNINDICDRYKLDLSGANFYRVIKGSIIFKLLLFSIYLLLWCIGVEGTCVSNALCIIVVILLIIAFAFSKNKVQFLINLSFIGSFWFIVYLLTGCIPLTFMNSFIENYEYIQLELTYITIPDDLQQSMETTISKLNGKTSPIIREYFNNGGPNNKGPNGVLLFNDDNDDNQFKFDPFPKIYNYFSKSFWELNAKYFDILHSKNIIQEYNNGIVHNKSNLNSIMVNRFIEGELYTGVYKFLPQLSNYQKHDILIASHIMHVWEHDILTKAKFYKDHFYIMKVLKTVFGYKSVYESAYNYWLNNMIVDKSIFTPIFYHFDIKDFTDSGTFHIQIYHDLIWAKLNLLLCDSYLSYDAPYIYKLANFDYIIDDLTKSLKSEYKSDFDSLRGIYKFDSQFYSQSKIIYLYYHSGLSDICAWDKTYTTSKLGLGLSHKFAYSNFSLTGYLSSQHILP